MLHEAATITVLRGQIQQDAFGAELALSVIGQAINDMLLGRKAKLNSNIYLRGKSAYLWMFEPQGRFAFWCNHLALDPEYVRSLIKQELKFNGSTQKRKPRRIQAEHHISG